jgi:hypothetical protein
MNFEQAEGAHTEVLTTTQFLADETTMEANKQSSIPFLSSLYSGMRINSQQTIIDFLRKPIVLDDGIFQSSDTSTTFPLFHLFDTVITNPLWTDKVRGFLGIRCTTVFTLQVNATRFIQGRYMLNFYPTCGAAGSKADDKLGMHYFSLETRTQSPGIQIDLNCETQVTLRIPFISSQQFYPLVKLSDASDDRAIGFVRVHPYVNANLATPYTLLCHLEDVELFGPTVPQMGSKSVQFDEQKKAGIGPVETNLRLVSRSTAVLSNIPTLAPFMAPTTLFVDMAAKIASIWGWSKPSIVTPQIPVFRHRGFQNPNVDGGDVSAKLSLSVKNEIGQSGAVFGTSLDEMSFDYIKTIPSYFRQVTWSNQAKEALIFNLSVRPNEFSNGYSDNGNGIYVELPCSVWKHRFKMYRGSFNFTIKAVKTEFHSGRLAIVYIPIDPSGADPSISYPLTYYANRTIIDIRYGNEWTFNLPFVSSNPWLRTDQYYGKFQIYVENPLQFPPTVTSSVTLLIEVSGGDDLEYAVPYPGVTDYVPYHPSAPQAGQYECFNFETPIGGAISHSKESTQALACIGEQFTSVRQILKRMEMRARLTTLATNNVVSVLPYAVGIVEGRGTAGTPTFPFLQADSYAFFAPMFAMARGSMRIKFYDPAPGASGSCNVYIQDLLTYTIPEMRADTNDSTGRNGPASFMGGMSVQVPVNDGLTGEVQIPMYTTSFAFPTADTFIMGNLGYNGTNTPRSIVCLSSTGSPNVKAPFPLRGVGDDFSFGYFISCVPMITSNNKYLAGYVG